MAFKYAPFSKKQMQLLTWWTENSPHKTKRGVIADGAVRSGKTIIMGLSYVFWSMSNYDRTNFAICGKTVSSTRRNIIDPLIEMLKMRGYKVVDRKTEGKLLVSMDGRINTYYIFGGRDESSASLIQGITLGGVLLDEVALMPRSFVEQAIARCSVSGAKYWFNCNPDAPRHWFKQEWLDKADEKRILHLHFLLYDNPSLDADTIERYETMFTGIFYKRFIEGEWAFADGVVYSNISDSCYYSNADRDKVVPVKIREHDIHPFYGVDYGTVNPMVYLEVYKYNKPDSRTPYFYVDNEYCFDSKKAFKQKTDMEYVQDFHEFCSDNRYRFLVIDPSAESIYVAHAQQGDRVIKAKNNVLEGISMLSVLFQMGHILINKDNCPNLVAELGLYQWDNKKAESGKQEVLKANDHSCDALRYAIYTTTPKTLVYGWRK